MKHPVLSAGRLLRCLGLATLREVLADRIADELYGKVAGDILRRMYEGRTKAAVDPLERDDLPSVGGMLTTWAQNVFARTILGRLATRPSEFAAPLALLTTSTSAAFVGEATAIPASAGVTTSETLERLKLAALVVASVELLNASSAEAVLTADMGSALVAAADRALLDGDAASDDVRPAAVTHGATPLDATGAATTADVDDVAGTLISTLVTAGSDLQAAAFITRPATALAIGSLRGSGGALSFPTVNVNGGTLAGLPLLTSASAPADQLMLVDGSQILLAREGAVAFSASREALIDQSSSPAGTTRVAMFQSEMVALKALLRINWALARPMVAYASSFAPPAPTWVTSP